jgi:flagellar assembly factor FliW
MPSVKTRSEKAAEMAETASQDLEIPVLEFVSPMPGFPDHHQFVLVRVHEEGVLYAMTSISEPDLRFLVVPPAPFFPDYEPEIDDESLAAMGATESDAGNLAVLLVVTAGDTAGSSTANLMAPIIVNEANRTACQLVLGGTWPVRAVLMPAA